MQRSAAGAGLVLLGSVLAGCLADEQPAPPPPYVFVDPLSSDPAHNHTLRDHHPEASNVTRLGHHALVDQEGEVANVHSIDLCGRWVVLGRERDGQYGVDIVDVADPTHPIWVGRYRDNNAVPGDRDVAWSADCNYVFQGNQGTRPDNSGVLVINARDKSKPVFESRYLIPGVVTPVPGASLGSGVHTVYALRVGNDQFVYALNWGVHILKFAPGPDGRMVLQLAGRYATADAERLAAVNEDGPDATATRRTIYGHDLTVYREGDRTIMYVAYAYDGLRIVDITNPAAPMDLGHWVPDETPGAPHYVHSVKSYRRADGTRITVLGSETFEDRNVDVPSPLWVLDTTNPGHVRLLSTWTNPGGHGSDRLLFSLHFYEVEDERLWLTHYHGGVWVLDLHDPARPAVAGYFMPQNETAYTPSLTCCSGWNWAGIPLTFDLKLRDGIAYAADFQTGLYILTLAVDAASASR